MGCRSSKCRQSDKSNGKKTITAFNHVKVPERLEAGEKPDTQPKSQRAATAAITSQSESKSNGIGPGLFLLTAHRAPLTERYQRERKLGSGAYGEVLLCRDRETGAERAIKIIKKSSSNSAPLSSTLLDEVAVVKQLDHPNIMKLYEFYEDTRNYYLVMEVYKGGELFDEIIHRQKFTEADAARVMRQVLSGVTYLHKNRIVHRDLKPENLLLENRSPDALIKIVDFGLSAIHEDVSKKLRERLGTAYYIAPEVLKQKYDQKCDVWSCGVILYILLCGYPPFGGDSDREILYRVERGKFYYDPADWDSISVEAKDLISRMLTLDVGKRISAEEALQHSWLRRGRVMDHVKAPSLRNALGNMRKFHATQKLAQAALLFMGSKMTTIEETKELTKIFRSLDRNSDGQLDRDELIYGYAQLVKLKGQADDSLITKEQIEAEVDKILETVDFDKNGYIEYSEFVTVAMDRQILLSRDRLKGAFALFDQDNSGTIAADELKRVCRKLTFSPAILSARAFLLQILDVDETQWNAIISDVDTNNDGEVDFDEFVIMMQKLARPSAEE